MTEQKFFICKHCGNIIAFVHASGAPITCCGDVMQELVPNSTDAAQEKHVPVVEVNGNVVTVTVGSTAHPMTDEHYIQWISLQSGEGNQRKELKPGAAPKAVFVLAEGDKPAAAYAYCNLHGLWKKEV
jgi:superoxide reductase